ncbi:MAG: ABC transporter ATP-binding protein [Phycisphaerales bacterium]
MSTLSRHPESANAAGVGPGSGSGSGSGNDAAPGTDISSPLRPVAAPGQPLLACRQVTVRYAIRYHYADTFKDSLFIAARQAVRRLRGVARPADGETRTNAVRSFEALKNIDLEIHRGDVIGLVGRNGAGKSTLLRHLAGIEEPDDGIIERNGTIGTLLNLSTGFKSELSGIENVYLRAAILGIPRESVDELLPRIIDFCELGEFFYAPFRTYSAGMKARIGFAVAIHINPDVLLLDEVIGVGDEKFKRKAGNIFNYLKEDRAVVLATHDSGTIKRYCTKCLWLDGGAIRAFGPADEVADAYVEAMSDD